MLLECGGAGCRRDSPLNSSQPPSCTLMAEIMAPKSIVELASSACEHRLGGMYQTLCSCTADNSGCQVTSKHHDVTPCRDYHALGRPCGRREVDGPCKAAEGDALFTMK